MQKRCLEWTAYENVVTIRLPVNFTGSLIHQGQAKFSSARSSNFTENSVQ